VKRLPLKVLFGERDDLYDYAEAVRARLAEVLASKPIAARDFGNFDCAVLHRTGNLQAELVQIQPDQRIPMHVHPHVSSIDLLVAGDVALVVNGKRIAHGYDAQRRSSFMKRAAIRIGANVVHGGTTAKGGVMFLSCQRWAVAPHHIALSWAGSPCTKVHEQILETVGGLS
jgi:hypothetical protein